MISTPKNDKYRSDEHEYRPCQTHPDVMFLEDNCTENYAEEDAEPFYGDHVCGFSQENSVPVTNRMHKEKCTRDQAFARLNSVSLEADSTHGQ